MSPLLAVIVLLVIAAIAFVAYEYFVRRSPSPPTVDPSTVVWELT
jgi:hypothetical protein